MGRTNWDAFHDSDDEELEGAKLERATYLVVGDSVTIYEAPDQSMHKLGWRKAGERLFCDAVGDNWVRLAETFVLGRGFEKRGWVMIEGDGDAGRLLKKMDNTKPAATASPKPAPAVPKPAVATTAPPKPVAAMATPTDTRSAYYQNWERVATAVDDDDEIAKAPASEPPVATIPPPATTSHPAASSPPAAEEAAAEPEQDDIGEPLDAPVAFEPNCVSVMTAVQ